MSRKEIIELLLCHKHEMIQKFSIKHLALFGSVARDDAGLESDVDILVEFEQTTFDHYMDLLYFLEEILHRKVDLATWAMIKPGMRPFLEKDVVHVA